MVDTVCAQKSAEASVPSGWRWPKSMHGRLVLIPTILLAFGLLGTIGIILLHTKRHVEAEITSSMQLGHDLATVVLHNVRAPLVGKLLWTL